MVVDKNKKNKPNKCIIINCDYDCNTSHGDRARGMTSNIYYNIVYMNRSGLLH